MCAFCIPVPVPGLARHAVLPSPPPASSPQLLLLSKLKAQLNHAESTLLQVLILKQLKVPLESITFEKPGEGSPLWLTNCCKTVSARKLRWNPILPSSGVTAVALLRANYVGISLAIDNLPRQRSPELYGRGYYGTRVTKHRSRGTSHQSLFTNHRFSSISQIEELPHLPELLVPRIQQFLDRLIRQRHQLPVQHFIQEPRRRFKVRVRPAFRLFHNFVYNPQFLQILGRNLHRRRGGL